MNEPTILPPNAAGLLKAERRETSQDELRRAARERVARGAEKGVLPSKFRAADLSWAFGDSDAALAELDRLELVAQEAAEAKRERDRRIHAGFQVRSLAEQIIKKAHKERDDAEMAAAIAEARRRLSLDDEEA